MILTTCEEAFLSVVRQWLQEQGEILVLFRYSRAAGSRDFYLFDSLADFHAKLQALPAQASVIVFRDYHLPLRGTIDMQMQQAALDLIPEAAGFLIVCLDPRDDWQLADQYDSWLPSHSESRGHGDLREELITRGGEKAAIGFSPAWPPDPETTIEAIVPNRDGTVPRGIY